MDDPHGTHKVLEVTVDRGAKKKPLVARFGGIELRWQKTPSSTTNPRRCTAFGARWCNAFWPRDASCAAPRKLSKSTTSASLPI